MVGCLLTGSFAARARSCQIETSAKILKINNVLDSSVLKKSDCSEETNRAVITFLSGASGKLKAKHLSRMLKNEYSLDIVFQGPVEIRELKDLVKNRLGLDKTVITKLSSLYGQASVNLDGNERISVECSKCGEAGERNIKFKIGKQTIWLSANLKVKRSGYRLLKDVSPFGQGFGPGAVEQTLALDDGKSLMFNNIKLLRFYRPNRPLAKGKMLKQNDLTPKTLVKFNQSVDVLLKGKNLSLKTKAVSRQNGKYGESVKLRNPKTGKNMTGKVIDFNTVAVEI